jgi:hypothetical protein
VRRVLAIFLILAVTTPALTAVAGAQSDVSGGPFDRDTLVENGVHDSDAPPSVRAIGEPTRGSVAIQYVPASPIKSEWQFIQPGQTIEGDTIRLYSTAYGPATGEYELVIVQWSDGTRTIDNENGSRTVPVASDQTVQRVDVELDDGYSTEEVTLASSYNDTKEVTMWLQNSGGRVDGATWRFQHTSVAGSQAVAIDTRSDAWWYAFRTAILPGVAGIIVGLSSARAVLKKAGTGPRYSLAGWAIVGVLGVGIALGGLFFEVAAVLANFEMLMGLSLGIIAFGGGLRMHAPVEKVGFERQHLTEGVSLRNAEETESSPVATDGGPTADTVIEIPEDGYHDELYEDLPIIPTVRGQDGQRRVPRRGIRPFFARLFADPAKLDISSLQTRVKVASGAIAEKIYVDPDGDADDAVDHTPARLTRRLPVWHRVADRVDELSMIEKAMYAVLTLGTVALPAVGYYAGEAAMQTPLVGAAVGTLILIVESHGAVDGSIDFEPAPRHFVSANASLTILQDEHADATLLEEFEEIAWNERTNTALEARDLEARRDDTVLQRINESAVGFDQEHVEPDEAIGGPDSLDVSDRKRGEADDD